MNDNKGVLIEGGELNKNTPLPFSEIMIVIIYDDLNENVELIVRGNCFNDVTVTMLNSYGNKCFVCTVLMMAIIIHIFWQVNIE